jgi:hypothetical protein
MKSPSEYERDLEIYREEIAFWHRRADERSAELVIMTERAEAAEAQCAAMREALEQVELVSDGDHSEDDYCPWCGMLRWETRHGPNCKREGALATDAGAKMLAVVRAARAWDAMGDDATQDEGEWRCDELSRALAALDAEEVTG